MSPIIYMMASVPPPAGGDVPKVETGIQSDDVVDPKGIAVLGEPIVGTEVITLDERGVGALPARPCQRPSSQHQRR